ncbi:MAG: hypothetical protein WCO63_01875 [Bacteroidota bacterium]
MKPKISQLLLIITILTVTLSCKKEAGIGGSSTIKGSVYAKYYDKTFTILNGEGWSQEQDVYIIYGNGSTYDDHVRTNYDGTFEFRYLEKGHYKVYLYSKDSTLTIPSGQFPVFREVEITKNHATIEIPKFDIFN